MIFQILPIIGLILTFYTIYVGNRSIEDPNYKAICDINDKISCSKVSTSKYSQMMFLPNSVYGILYYILVFMLSFRYTHYIFYLTIPVALFGLYLIYLMLVKIKKICLVCLLIHILSFIILYLVWRIEII